MQNKEEYLLALTKAIKHLNKYKKLVKTRAELLEIKKTLESLSSLYYEIKGK